MSTGYNSWARGCNNLGRGTVGSWSRSDYRRTQSEHEHARQRALLDDQIRIGGLRMELWRKVDSGNRCSCYKESTQQSDLKCRSCHGSSWVPGYLKFGYEAFWMSSVDDDITFTNVHISREFKSSKVVLDSSATEGSVVSGDKAFSRGVAGSQWEYDVSSFVRLEGYSSVMVEYSLDSGRTWKDIASLVTENPESGVIRFRATLTRDTTDVLSPMFEIVRARYASIPYSDEVDAGGSPRYGPWILAMRSVPQRSFIKSEEGDRPEQRNLMFWTSGLSLFDPSIEVGSDDELLSGPGVVVNVLDGVMAGSRYVVTTWKQSDPLGYKIVNQEFTLRIENPSGPYSLLW